jgi:tetratricopeptide (TPR) repeat protein
MDRRKLLVCLGAFALAGCVPSTSKDTSIEAKAPPAVEQPAPTKSSLTNLFGEKKKESMTVYLAFAKMREAEARKCENDPDRQFTTLDEARKVYQEALNHDQACLEACRGLGRVYVAMGDYERATATYKKAIEKLPREASLYAEFAVVYSKRNNFTEAIRLLTKATELDPENQDYLRMLGVDLVCNGEVDRGVQALARARGAAAAHYYVARIFYRKGQIAEARDHAQRAVEANPNLQDARNLLAELNEPARPGDVRPGDVRPRDIRLTNDER